MIWVCVSSPLLEHLRRHNCGITIESSIDKPAWHLTAITFVDDNDMLQRILELHNLIATTQRSLDLWADALRVTGGAVSAEKSSWSPLVHKWSNDKWSIDNNFALHDQITILTDDGSRQALSRCPPNNASLALGVMFSPAGNMTHHFTHLKQKCKDWANKIKQSKLSRYEAFTAMNKTIWKTIEYSLPATTMTEAQCNELASIILTAGLPKSGICRNTDRDPVFSSKHYFGFGLQHPYFVQGIRKVMMLLNPSDELNQFLIDEAFHQILLETGLGPSIFATNPTSFRSVTTDGWFNCIWEFFYKTKISLTSTVTPNICFPEDKFIMRLIPRYTGGKDLAIFNACRLHLRAELISDILTLDGSRIRNDIWFGNPNPTKHDKRQWPPQPKPSTKAWKLWRHILQSAFDTSSNGILRTPIQIPSVHHTSWIWYYCENSYTLFEVQTDTTIAIWSPISLRSRHLRYPRFQRTRQTIPTIPTSAKPCTTQQKPHFVILESVTARSTTPVSIPSPPKISDYMNITYVGDIDQLRTSFLSGELTIVSDGSSCNGFGAGAWVISSKAHYPTHQILGSIPSPGNPHMQDSHRSECSGILGALLTLQRILRRWNLTNGSVRFACDNKSAIRYSFDYLQYPVITGKHPDFDILQSIRSLTIPNLTIDWFHVKGHQDKLMGALTFEAHLNTIADSLANQRRQTLQSSLLLYSLPNDKWSLIIPTGRLGQQLESQLYQYCSKQRMLIFWERKRGWNTNTFHTINWDAILLAQKHIPTQKCNWISKHATGNCGVNSTLLRWKQRLDDHCPRCGQTETPLHVWKCRGSDTNRIWTRCLDELDNWMTAANTESNLQSIIISNLTQWHKDSLSVTNRSTLEHAQDIIGWDFVLEGTITTLWEHHQQAHYSQMGIAYSGKRWISELIRKLWNIAWDLWEYRNEVAHASNHQELLTSLQNQIRDEFDKGPPSHNSSSFFSDELRAQLTTSTVAFQQAWLAHITTLRQHHAQNHIPPKGLQQMRRTLRRFLQSANT